MTLVARAATVAWLLIGAHPAQAQTATPLSLADAQRRAVAHAPQVADARARVAAADAAVLARAAAAKPTVTALTSLLRTNHVEEFGVPQAGGGTRVIFPDIPSNYRLRAEANVPLYTGGRVASLVDAARADVGAADADRRAVEADVQLEVTRAYWLLVTTRESARVLQSALDRADAVVRDVAARVDAGVAPPNEIASARAQRARQQVRLIQARQDVELAAADLRRQIGAPAAETFELTTPLDQPIAAAVAVERGTADATAAQARDARPERQGLEHRQAALRATANAALASMRPQIGAVAAVEPARPNPRFVPREDVWRLSWDLGAQFSWTLFDGGRARAERAAATATAEALGHRVRLFDEVLTMELDQRRAELVSGRAALAASDEAVAAAAEAHRVLQERFAAGVATSTEVLDGEVARLEAELERTRLLASLRLAEARLLRTVGAGQ